MMNPHRLPNCLQPTDIQSLFEGALTPEESVLFESHLTECSTCQQRIEQTIGTPQWWSEVQHSLQSPDPMTQFEEWTDEAVSLSAPSRSAGEATRAAADDALPRTMQQLLDLLGPSDDPAMLGRIGHYEITGLLGQGGMGAVFKGFDRSLNRFVAIKMLLPHLASSAAARKRFAREAQAVAAVVDDHVMPVHFVGEWQGIPYLVMTYSKGVSLQSRLDEQGTLELKEILRIALQAARGLAAAHTQGLVHRDVKPANIFLSENVERVQLMDFGLARAADDASLTRTGILAGTPQYMSPEQARAEQVDGRSDLFSLGSVMYAMCTGRPPFRAESSHSVLRLITDKDPRPIREINPDLPDWLSVIIQRLMSKQAADRPHSAEETAELLEDCLAHVQQPDSTPLPEGLRPAPRANRAKVAALVLTLCFVALGPLVFSILVTPASNIEGTWEGKDWGVVELKQVKQNVYEGTYANAFGGEKGAIQLKWSRTWRRYQGTWGKDSQRFGKISMRRVGTEIRGAWTTKDKADVSADVPDFGSFTLRRHVATPSPPEPRNTKPHYSYNYQAKRPTPPNITIRATPIWKRNFKTDHGLAIAHARDGRIAIARAVERESDPNAGIEDIVIDHILELLPANSMGQTLSFDVGPTRPHVSITALTFSPDGKYLALGDYGGRISIFETDTRTLVRSLPEVSSRKAEQDDAETDAGSASEGFGRVSAIAFSPDSQLLAACGPVPSINEPPGRKLINGDGLVRVWDTKTGVQRYEMKDLSHASDVAFSPSGEHLACAGQWINEGMAGTGVLILQASNGKRTFTWGTMANGGTRQIAYSPTGSFLTREQQFDNAPRTNIRLWNNRTPQQHTVTEYANDAAFSTDGSLAATLGRRKFIRFLTGDRLLPLHEVNLDTEVQWSHLEFGKQYRRFVVAGIEKSGDARVELWSYRIDERDAGSSKSMQRSMWWAGEASDEATTESSAAPRDEPADQGTTDSPESNADRPNNVDGVNGSCQVPACIESLKLRKVSQRTYKMEVREGAAYAICFEGKGGRIRAEQSSNRIYALATPTRLVEFEMAPTQSRFNPFGSKFHEELKAPIDYVHVNWSNKEHCVIEFYAKPTEASPEPQAE